MRKTHRPAELRKKFQGDGFFVFFVPNFRLLFGHILIARIQASMQLSIKQSASLIKKSSASLFQSPRLLQARSIHYVVYWFNQKDDLVLKDGSHSPASAPVSSIMCGNLATSSPMISPKKSIQINRSTKVGLSIYDLKSSRKW